VNSESELRAAEKKYRFVHAASWGMADAAPQHDADAGNIARDYRKKFNCDPAAYHPENVTGVSAGCTPERTAPCRLCLTVYASLVYAIDKMPKSKQPTTKSR
jgi:hypothetical protein